MYKLIVAGSRKYDDARYAFSVLEKILKTLPDTDIVIVSGGAKGADTIGEQFAKSKGLQTEILIPDWDGQGKKAGYMRNESMAKISQGLCAFWNGESPGTKHMLSLAHKYKLNIHLEIYTTHNNAYSYKSYNSSK